VHKNALFLLKKIAKIFQRWGSTLELSCFRPLVLPHTLPKLPLRIPGYATGSIIGGSDVLAQLVEHWASNQKIAKTYSNLNDEKNQATDKIC